jgi:hypothetical protein
MNVSELAVVDVRGPLTAQRQRLLSLLAALNDGQWAAPAARLSMSGEAAWRLLTGARYDASQVNLSGDMTLAEPLLSVRGIIV